LCKKNVTGKADDDDSDLKPPFHGKAGETRGFQRGKAFWKRTGFGEIDLKEGVKKVRKEIGHKLRTLK